MGQAQQARLGVRVVAELTPEAHRVFVTRRIVPTRQNAIVLAQRAERIVELRVECWRRT